MTVDEIDALSSAQVALQQAKAVAECIAHAGADAADMAGATIGLVRLLDAAADQFEEAIPVVPS